MMHFMAGHVALAETRGKAMTDTVQIPAGFQPVTKEEFFEALYADKRDIMPSISESPYNTNWETKGRVRWGWSAPGWKNPRGEKIFALNRGA
ncbi:hypothetical protein [Paraburkholderia unamae]|uniref:Uncharacterized protein n=1 Tax=Paraburkholderia unamae TaxID=219649 RepID=A0ACC6RXX0_9BURK